MARTRPAPDGAVARRRACTISERIASGERPLAARTSSARWLSRLKTCISAFGRRRAPGLAALIAAERTGQPLSNEDFGDVAPVPVVEPRQQPAVGVGLQVADDANPAQHQLAEALGRGGRGDGSFCAAALGLWG